MGSLPITYCTDFPGTNKILSLSWRDLSLNKCRVTTTRIWLGGGEEIHMYHCHMLPWLCWSLVPSPHTHSLYWALTQREKSANIWHLCTPFQYFPDFFGIGVIKISNFGKLGKNYLVISHCDDTQWLPMTRHLGCFLSVSIRSRTQFWECCSILLLLYLSLISWRVATLVTQPKNFSKLLSVSKIINIISPPGLNIIFDEYV